MTDLLKHLRRLAKQLGTTLIQPNRGGCCVIAAEVAAQLEKIVPTRIRVSNDDCEAEDNANLNQMVDYLGPQVDDHNAWNDAYIFFGHVIVEFDYQGKTYHMDTSGVRLAKKRDPSFNWPMYDGHLPLHAAKALADIPGNWNKKFNRDQIPHLRKMVKDVLSPLSSNPISV